MSKFSGRRGFGRGSVGTVTVLEARVLRSSARYARLGFVVTAFVVGLLTMSIAADRLHPIVALLLGLVTGIVCGACVWLLIRIWPVVRLLWWWATEIIIAVDLVSGWTMLARHTSLVVRLLIVAIVVGVPASIPPVRRLVVSMAWCLIVRHRLRTCFAQFIISNQSGSLPLILVAWPTPVGERVWIYLRPGLSMADLESRLDKIAVACHATSVIVERAGSSAAFLRLDVKRREVLTTTVDSPLVDLVDPDTPATVRIPGDVPTALDLPDVHRHPDKPVTSSRVEPAKPRPVPVTTPAASSSLVPVVTGPDGEDVSDYI